MWHLEINAFLHIKKKEVIFYRNNLLFHDDLQISTPWQRNKATHSALTNTKLIALTMTKLFSNPSQTKERAGEGRKLNRNYHKIHHCNSRGLSVAVFG